MDDPIRRALIDRAKKLKCNSVDIARECVATDGGATPDITTVRRYFSGLVSLNSRYVSQVAEVLGMEMRVKPKPRAT